MNKADNGIMNDVFQKIEKIFTRLDKRIDDLRKQRWDHGELGVSKVEVKLLGQMSLLVNQKVAAILSLTQTADLDAFLTIDSFVKDELKALLKEEGLVYDEDSPFIWIPADARFEELFQLKNISVAAIDPESALVSKAVKAPDKNKLLIREAIASSAFPGLVDRILKNGGDLENFV